MTTTDKIMDTAIAAGIDDANLGKLVRHLHANPVGESATQAIATPTPWDLVVIALRAVFALA